MTVVMCESAKDAARRLAKGVIAKGFHPEALHFYRDANGRILYARIRCKHPTTGEKWIRPMFLNGEMWQLGEPKLGDRKPLYGLERLANAPLAMPVYIVEGEKPADSVANLGALSTTSGGADSADRADWSPCEGRRCIIWVDNDDPGQRYGEAVERNLAGIAASVVWVNVEVLGLEPKEDAFDWIEAHPGATLNDLLALPQRSSSGTTAPTPAPHEPRAEVDLVSPTPLPTSGWGAPKPLPSGLPDVTPFDFMLLPASLRGWAEDICERVQCPPDFVAATIMAALGTVIGRKVLIGPQERTDWVEAPNQWALLVGRPGVLKSPAMEAALAPLKRLATKAAEQYNAAAETHRHVAKLAKLRTEAGEKAARTKLSKDAAADVSADLALDEPEEPKLRRYIATDPTGAALGELLRQNANGVLVNRDEMVSLLKALDRDDNAETRGFYLTGWNGNSSYTFDRIGRGLNLHVPAVCLSLLGSTQPGRIAEYLRAAVKGGAGDDGLIQRFGLLVWPDISGEWRDVDRWPDSEARRGAHSVFERLDSLNADDVGAQRDDFGGAPFVRFDAESLALFRQWREHLERRIRGGELHPALESHLAKYRKLVPTLALILHLADPGSGSVGAMATLQALAWAEYLESHARRAYASVSSPELASAGEILRRIRSGDLAREFAARDVYRNGWTHLSDTQQVLDALQLLTDLDWVAPEGRITAGRTGTVWVVNPKGFR